MDSTLGAQKNVHIWNKRTAKELQGVEELLLNKILLKYSFNLNENWSQMIIFFESLENVNYDWRWPLKVKKKKIKQEHEPCKDFPGQGTLEEPSGGFMRHMARSVLGK